MLSPFQIQPPAVLEFRLCKFLVELYRYVVARNANVTELSKYYSAVYGDQRTTPGNWLNILSAFSLH
jgi:hypothetical protein